MYGTVFPIAKIHRPRNQVVEKVEFSLVTH